jgi:hypothetical protein
MAREAVKEKPPDAGAIAVFYHILCGDACPSRHPIAGRLARTGLVC